MSCPFWSARGVASSRTIQELLGHNHVDTTRYTDVPNQGTGVLSPLDDALAVSLHAGDR